jgi:hypothetical protein
MYPRGRGGCSQINTGNQRTRKIWIELDNHNMRTLLLENYQHRWARIDASTHRRIDASTNQRIDASIVMGHEHRLTTTTTTTSLLKEDLRRKAFHAAVCIFPLNHQKIGERQHFEKTGCSQIGKMMRTGCSQIITRRRVRAPSVQWSKIVCYRSPRNLKKI